MKSTKPYTIIIFAENKPGVLYRIADLFLRRKINIESLTVLEIESRGMSRFTIVLVKKDFHIIENVVKQLYRIIEVVKVFEKTDEELLFKEISLIKVATTSAEKRREIEILFIYLRQKLYLSVCNISLLRNQDQKRKLTTCIRYSNHSVLRSMLDRAG